MKIALGQINTTPNDFEGNLQKIIHGINSAGKAEADLIVFPELSIPGYLCKDLLYRKVFLRKNADSLAEICAVSRDFPDLTIVVGYVGKNISGPGKPFTNMAAAIRGGLVLCHYQKQLLPFYDVFDEGRYFEPGTQPGFIEVSGKKCLLTICEDIWNDKGQDDYNYVNNPLSDLRDVDMIINISSSPYSFGKPEKRFKMLQEISRHVKPSEWAVNNQGLRMVNGTILVYVNQIGGQDELVFDGRSCIVVDGILTYQIPSTKSSASTCPIIKFSDDSDNIEITEFSRPTTQSRNRSFDLPKTRPEKDLYNSVVIGLRDYIEKTGFKEVVLGSSGGIDSALVAALACDAIGPENVHCIMMPSIFSSRGSSVDAVELHHNLGCNEYTVPIEHQHLVKSINSYLDLSNDNYNDVADENIQARIRGLTIMHASNAYGFLPLTTGNKTELALGYCTLYGDMNGGFNPIADLYKDQVFALAHYINNEQDIIPKAIINKAPSAELAEDQTDQEGLGAPYGFLNAVVRAFVEHHINDYACFKSWWKSTPATLNYPFVTEQDKIDMKGLLDGELAEGIYYDLIRRIDMMEFKRRQAAPTIKVSSVAFGTGRRLPIVQKVSRWSKPENIKESLDEDTSNGI